MTYEELLDKYLEEGYSKGEAEEKARQDLEEQEHLDWLHFQELHHR